jgi:hypothetical protein
MPAESRIARVLESMLSAIDSPPSPTRAILDRAAAALPAEPRRIRPYARFALVAAATIALVFAIFPKTSVALIERIVVDSYAAAYRVIGWTPPPNPPKALDKAAESEQVSLAAAQTRVPFRIVPPAGLPSDAVLTGIHTMPVLSYDEAKHVWSKDSPTLAFEYRRADGRAFQLVAEKDDPRTGAPPRSIFEAEDLPGGKVALTRRAHYAWTNGDQMISVNANGITVAEIKAICAAMNGQPVHHNARETVTKRYSLRS